MADREHCLFCLREKAIEADWETNAQLPDGVAEDREAERLGLNKLCWESGDDACGNAALESGRPANLEDALAQCDQLDQQVEALLSAINHHRNEASPTSTPQKFSLDGALYAAADQVRMEREDA